MAEVIHFAPRVELDADENLRAFVHLCRNELTAFGKDLPFDEPVWVVTYSINLKARNIEVRLIFSDWLTSKALAPAMLTEPFGSFAKAYVRYQHAVRPTKNPAFRLIALRALERALTENGGSSRPSGVTSETLNRAAQLLKEKYESATAHRIGGQLEILAQFLVNKHLLVTPLSWRNPLQRPRDTVRVGTEFDQKRQEKLPSARALDSLARIFNQAKEPPDVLVSSIAAILCSAPDRINEVLLLEADCEVTQTVPSSGTMAYGLRWRPSKGAEPMIKWLVGSMGSVVQRAIANIRELTAPARAIARWYENHPDRIYLPTSLEHLRTRARLNLGELGGLLFTEETMLSNVSNWCRTHKVPTAKHDDRVTVSFADVERAVLSMLPRGFPVADTEQGLKYSEALCVVQTNALHARRGTYRCMMYLVGQGDVANRLGSRSETGIPSIFDRFGFFESDGSRINIRSHQFRHYLNTLAQAGGLSQLDIAKWSGRVDVSQNKTYDHQSDRDINALVRRVTGDSSAVFAPLPAARKATLVSRDECGRLNLAAAHTTDYGYCVHDYTLLPCQLHRDCMNCDEQVCVKGDDPLKEANVRRLAAETRTLLAQAETAHAEGNAGANRWVEHQRMTLSHAQQLCEILDDPQVPVGTAIRLRGIVPASRLEQALARRRLLNERKALPSFMQGEEVSS